MSLSLKTQTVFILALAGVLDTLYLTTSFFTHDSVVCILGSSCDVVTTSVYATWFGVPVALVGLLYYLFLATGAAFIYYGLLAEKRFLFLKLLSIAGVAASAWFVYLQLFVLNSICTYCILSALLSLMIFSVLWMPNKGI